MNEERKAVLDRLSRIEGQLRGIRGMIERERDCYDIVKQIAAVKGAMRSLGLLVMKHHLCDCVRNMKEDSAACEQVTEQLVELFDRVSS